MNNGTHLTFKWLEWVGTVNQISTVDFAQTVTTLIQYIITITLSGVVLMMVLGSVQYLFGQTSVGTERIKNALSGLVLLICMSAILYSIDPVFFQW